jgi:hypothetical protein
MRAARTPGNLLAQIGAPTPLRIRTCMFEAELVSVAMDEVSPGCAAGSHSLNAVYPPGQALAVLTSIPWVGDRTRKPAGTCLQVGIRNRPRNHNEGNVPAIRRRRPYRAGFQIAIRVPSPSLKPQSCSEVFHIYVMPCRRGKRILGLGSPV